MRELLLRSLAVSSRRLVDDSSRNLDNTSVLNRFWYGLTSRIRISYRPTPHKSQRLYTKCWHCKCYNLKVNTIKKLSALLSYKGHAPPKHHYFATHSHEKQLTLLLIRDACVRDFSSFTWKNISSSSTWKNISSIFIPMLSGLRQKVMRKIHHSELCNRCGSVKMNCKSNEIHSTERTPDALRASRALTFHSTHKEALTVTGHFAYNAHS